MKFTVRLFAAGVVALASACPLSALAVGLSGILEGIIATLGAGVLFAGKPGELLAGVFFDEGPTIVELSEGSLMEIERIVSQNVQASFDDQTRDAYEGWVSKVRKYNPLFDGECGPSSCGQAWQADHSYIQDRIDEAQDLLARFDEFKFAASYQCVATSLMTLYAEKHSLVCAIQGSPGSSGESPAAVLKNYRSTAIDLLEKFRHWADNFPGPTRWENEPFDPGFPPNWPDTRSAQFTVGGGGDDDPLQTTPHTERIEIECFNTNVLEGGKRDCRTLEGETISQQGVEKYFEGKHDELAERAHAKYREDPSNREVMLGASFKQVIEQALQGACMVVDKTRIMPDSIPSNECLISSHAWDISQGSVTNTVKSCEFALGQ